MPTFLLILAVICFGTAAAPTKGAPHMTNVVKEHVKAINDILGTCATDHPEAASECLNAMSHLDKLTTEFDSLAHNTTQMALVGLETIISCERLKTLVKLGEQLILTMEARLRVMAKVQDVCRGDSEGAEFLGSDLYLQVIGADLDVFKGKESIKKLMGLER